MSRLNRPFSTVILNRGTKQDLLDDASDYLNPLTRQWYANRGIPYRRGYLLHGPPGTGKSSLSLALAGFFGMKMYIISLSSTNASEENITALFSGLPNRCIVLLEDIDSAGLTHTREDEEPADIMPPSNPPSPTFDIIRGLSRTGGSSGGLSLSGLLNILDGIASQEGRILIMTTNHIEKLDKALIRPGRVDMIIPFGLADKEMVASIFRAVYALYENEDQPAGHQAHEKLAKGLATNTDFTITTGKTAEAGELVESMAIQFSAKIPELEFSPAEIQGLLLRHKRLPEKAIEAADAWVSQMRKSKQAKFQTGLTVRCNGTGENYSQSECPNDMCGESQTTCASSVNSTDSNYAEKVASNLY